MLLIVLGIWLTFIIDRLTILAKNYPECDGYEKLNTFVASWESCSKYIYCDGHDSFVGECLGDNVFNEKEGNCDDPEAVICHGSENNIKEESDISDDKEYHGNLSNVDEYVSDLIQGNDPITDTSQTNALSPPSPSPSSPSPSPSTTTTSILNGFPLQTQPQCPPQGTDKADIIHLPNPSSCASYYTCYNGIAISMICGRNMHFSEQSGKCEPQNQVSCTLKRPIDLKCSRGIYAFMPHPRNCDYYYFCSNGFLMILQCPFKYTWNYELRTCVHQSQSKCFSTSSLRQKMLLA